MEYCDRGEGPQDAGNLARAGLPGVLVLPEGYSKASSGDMPLGKMPQ